MAGRKKSSRPIGNGLESLFGAEQGETEPFREPANPLGRSNGAVLLVLVLLAFLSGGAVESVLSKAYERIAPGPPGAKAASVPGQMAENTGVPKTSGRKVPAASPVPPADPDFIPPPAPAALHRRALRGTLHTHFPLTPEDITLLRKIVKETQEAVHGPPPVGRAVSVSVSLDPGAPFPEIHLVPGIATTITVVDATGAPWPIDDVVVGNRKSFPVRRLRTPNGVVVEPKNNVGWTSLSLVLRGRGTPAVLRLVDSDHFSDTRVTARIEARGPNAVAPIFREPKPVVSSRILAYLDGIPPSTAREMHVAGTTDMEAWLDGNRLFVRTHMDVLAPAWLETVSGPNGMKLYVFPPVAVLTAAGEDGEPKTVELGEGEADARQ